MDRIRGRGGMDLARRILVLCVLSDHLYADIQARVTSAHHWFPDRCKYSREDFRGSRRAGQVAHWQRSMVDRDLSRSTDVRRDLRIFDRKALIICEALLFKMVGLGWTHHHPCDGKAVAVQSLGCLLVFAVKWGGVALRSRDPASRSHPEEIEGQFHRVDRSNIILDLSGPRDRA